VKRIAVIGAGAWGTAVAVHIARLGFETTIWCFDEETARQIAEGENKNYLAGIAIPPALRATIELADCVEGASAIFFAVPVQHLAGVISGIRPGSIHSEAILVNLSKGIERNTGRLPSQIIEDRFSSNRGVLTLSGPSLAEEVARERPTVMVCAGALEPAEAVQRLISADHLRIYRSSDRIGVDISSALKNVLALGSGICDGLGLGENGRAALIVRGLAEMRRLSVALGAEEQTIFGIAGLGDLVLTCTSGRSRNHDFGRLLAMGRSTEEILSEKRWVAEGVFTAPAALELARKRSIELPITERVTAVLEGRTTPREAAKALMTRPLREEFY